MPKKSIVERMTKLLEDDKQQLFDLMDALRRLGKAATPTGMNVGPIPKLWNLLSDSEKKKVQAALKILTSKLKAGAWR